MAPKLVILISGRVWCERSTGSKSMLMSSMVCCGMLAKLTEM